MFLKWSKFKSFSFGFILALIISGAVSYVNAANDATTIYSCVNKKSGSMRYSPKKKCATNEYPLSWNVSGLTGAQGRQGDQGLQGPRGMTGERGAQGETGLQGLPGAQGLTGPAGAQGPTGATGAQGPTGLQGPTGATGAQGPAGPASQTPNYEIGDSGPAGGKIFITPRTIGNTTGQYFEVAPNDWNGGTGDPTSIWCDSTGNITSYTSYVGKGAEESAMIISKCATSAADLADSYSVVVNQTIFADWYLPSASELVALYENRLSISALSVGAYWGTTTDSPSGGVKSLAISSTAGTFSAISQSSTAYVRPIRSFK